VATLRDYLKIEFKAKKGVERDYNKDSIRGALPKVPQQNNFTDCGIFMLQYAESFFEVNSCGGVAFNGMHLASPYYNFKENFSLLVLVIEKRQLNQATILQNIKVWRNQ
jgi:Ulp1 family protease